MRETDKEIIAIRRGWQAGLTLSQTFKRINKRFGFDNKPKLIAEWRKMKKLFGCASAPVSYIEGWRYRGNQSSEPSQQELNSLTGQSLAGGRTYGEWKGITGPGKMLQDILAKERS